MKKETIKYIIQLIVAILTAIGSTLSVTTGGHWLASSPQHAGVEGEPLPRPLLCREGSARQRWEPHTQFVGMGFIAHQQGT